ncbi:MAG: hypothetical protein M1837_005395 [Sclerophora amabilis]|nr:MAG: hypothetical protein M1837_005395 [Sclerophora amabilis]
MPKNVLFPGFLPSVEAVRLGRFITNLKQPNLSFHDPEYQTPPTAIVTPQLEFAGSHQTGADDGLHSTLLALLSFALSRRAERRIKVTTETVNTHSLSNALTWFKEATKLENTRKWLEDAIGGEDVFFIVGFRTISNARISDETLSASGVLGQAQAPLSAALATAGVVVPLQKINPSLGGHHQAADGVRAHFKAPGETVCALQYLKLRHSFLSSSQVDKTTLSKNPQWNIYEATRNASAGIEDILEVNLDDDEVPEGNWETKALLGEEILIPV